MALPVILLVLVVLAIMGAGLRMFTGSQLGWLRKRMLRQRAFYGAESGVEYVVGTLAHQDFPRRAFTRQMRFGPVSLDIYARPLPPRQGCLYLQVLAKGKAEFGRHASGVLHSATLSMSTVDGAKVVRVLSSAPLDPALLRQHLEEGGSDSPESAPEGREDEPKRERDDGGKGQLPGLRGLRRLLVRLEDLREGRDDRIDLQNGRIAGAFLHMAHVANRAQDRARLARRIRRRLEGDRLDEALAAIPMDSGPEELFRSRGRGGGGDGSTLDRDDQALPPAAITLAKVEEEFDRLGDLPVDLEVEDGQGRHSLPAMRSAMLRRLPEAVLGPNQGTADPARVFETLQEKATELDPTAVASAFASLWPRRARVRSRSARDPLAWPPPEVGRERPAPSPWEPSPSAAGGTEPLEAVQATPAPGGAASSQDLPTRFAALDRLVSRFPIPEVLPPSGAWPTPIVGADTGVGQIDWSWLTRVFAALGSNQAAYRPGTSVFDGGDYTRRPSSSWPRDGRHGRDHDRRDRSPSMDSRHSPSSSFTGGKPRSRSHPSGGARPSGGGRSSGGGRH